MKRKCLLALLPALLALASCGNVPKVEPKPELNNIVEDTLAHDEIFGKSKIAGNLGVRKAYDADVDVPEDYVSASEPTIGIQTKTTGDKISIRFVAAIKIVDFNDDGVIDSLDLADTNVFWIRSIYEDDGDVTVVSARKQSTTVYTAVAAPSDVEDDGIDDNILTIDEFNNEVPGRDYTHFAVYTLLDLPLSLGDYYINVAVGRTNITNGFYPSISKVLATTIDQKTQFTFSGTGYVCVTKTESGFDRFDPDANPDGNHARFLNIPIPKDGGFLIVNKEEDVGHPENDRFEVYGYDKVHLGDSGDNTFSQLGSSQFAKAKYDLMEYHIFLSAGVGTDYYIYTNCVKRYYLVPTATWADPDSDWERTAQPEGNGGACVRYAIWKEINGVSEWYSMLYDDVDDYWYADLVFPAPGNLSLIIFVKMWGNNSTNGWNGDPGSAFRNQTGNLTWQPEKNQYTIAAKDNSNNNDANWSVHYV